MIAPQTSYIELHSSSAPADSLTQDDFLVTIPKSIHIPVKVAGVVSSTVGCLALLLSATAWVLYVISPMVWYKVRKTKNQLIENLDGTKTIHYSSWDSTTDRFLALANGSITQEQFDAFVAEYGDEDTVVDAASTKRVEDIAYLFKDDTAFANILRRHHQAAGNPQIVMEAYSFLWNSPNPSRVQHVAHRNQIRAQDLSRRLFPPFSDTALRKRVDADAIDTTRYIGHRWNDVDAPNYLWFPRDTYFQAVLVDKMKSEYPHGKYMIENWWPRVRTKAAWDFIKSGWSRDNTYSKVNAPTLETIAHKTVQPEQEKAFVDEYTQSTRCQRDIAEYTLQSDRNDAEVQWRLAILHGWFFSRYSNQAEAEKRLRLAAHNGHPDAIKMREKYKVLYNVKE